MVISRRRSTSVFWTLRDGSWCQKSTKPCRRVGRGCSRPSARELLRLRNKAWTPGQLEARSHPNMIKAQIAMSQLYTVGSEQVEVDLKSQAMYADRFRVREAGVSHMLPEHLDNGSIERWEDHSYSACYRAIWEGRWEEYDAWDMTHRADAVTDLYGGPGACSVFRSIQGWLSMANNGPGKGTLQLLPDIKLSTAYMLLRPFFDDEGKLDMESTYFYGAAPGMGQVLKQSCKTYDLVTKHAILT